MSCSQYLSLTPLVWDGFAFFARLSPALPGAFFGTGAMIELRGSSCHVPSWSATTAVDTRPKPVQPPNHATTYQNMESHLPFLCNCFRYRFEVAFKATANPQLPNPRRVAWFDLVSRLSVALCEELRVHVALCILLSKEGQNQKHPRPSVVLPAVYGRKREGDLGATTAIGGNRVFKYTRRRRNPVSVLLLSTTDIREHQYARCPLARRRRRPPPPPRDLRTDFHLRRHDLFLHPRHHHALSRSHATPINVSPIAIDPRPSKPQLLLLSNARAGPGAGSIRWHSSLTVEGRRRRRRRGPRRKR